MNRGGPGVVGKRLSDLPYSDLQHGVPDEAVLPDRADQVLLADELSGSRDKFFEHAERLGPEPDDVGVLPEAQVHPVEGERMEVNATFVRHVLSALSA
jgi:hypothetical protein